MQVLLNILEFIGALALFVFGMKQMSSGIQKAAGASLRRALQSITRNKYLGFTTGLLITSLIQSSSAVTVMTVSFVNAGLLTLAESAGVIIGANVGTTVTAWIISILEFKIQLHQLTLPIIAVAVPMLFVQKSNIKYWGEFLLGFALLFLGLSLMRDIMPHFSEDPDTLQFLKSYANKGLASSAIFILAGLVITFIIQSSTAALVLIMVMCTKGWIGYDLGIMMVLGANIGTTITAEIASIIGNVYAKRSARIHSFFNILGVLLFFPLLPVILPLLEWMMQSIRISAPSIDPENIPLFLSAFHTFFNIANAMIFLPFVGILVKLAEWSVKSKKKEDFKHHLDYIALPLKTSELSLLEVNQEVTRFTEIVKACGRLNLEFLLQTDPEEQIRLYKKIKKLEKSTARINEELVEYLTKLAQEETSRQTSLHIRMLLTHCSHLERAAVLYISFTNVTKQKIQNRIWFNNHQRSRLKEIFNILDKLLELIGESLSTGEQSKSNSMSTIQLQESLDQLYITTKSENLEELYPEDYNHKSSYTYTNLSSILEEIGHHVKSMSDLYFQRQ